MNFIEEEDPEVWAAIAAEIERQEDGLEMIASENYTSPAIMQAVGSVLTNNMPRVSGPALLRRLRTRRRGRRPGPRSGQETLRRRHVNVQPHSGSQANMAVYLSAIEAGRHGAGAGPGPRRPSDARHEAQLLGQALSLCRLWRDPRHAPHRLRPGRRAGQGAQTEIDRGRRQRYPREIPHGKFAEIAKRSGPNCLSTWRIMPAWWPPACTTIRCRWPISSPRPRTKPSAARGGLAMCREEYAKDLDRNVFPGIQGGPLMHVIAGKAICFGEACAGLQELCPGVIDNAKTLAEVLLAGGGRLISGGTDNHLLLLDVTPLGLAGKQAEAVLGACGITVNKNMIPYDERKPLDPSASGMGTPALTTRGMGSRK